MDSEPQQALELSLVRELHQQEPQQPMEQEARMGHQVVAQQSAVVAAKSATTTPKQPMRRKRKQLLGLNTVKKEVEPAAIKLRQQCRKKLAAFDPSLAEVDACFAQLAPERGRGVSEESVMQVGHTLGQELERPAVQNMMSMAAERVLGWSSGAGRQHGRLSLPEFRSLVDHFRVAGS